MAEDSSLRESGRQNAGQLDGSMCTFGLLTSLELLVSPVTSLPAQLVLRLLLTPKLKVLLRVKLLDTGSMRFGFGDLVRASESSCAGPLRVAEDADGKRFIQECIMQAEAAGGCRFATFDRVPASTSSFAAPLGVSVADGNRFMQECIMQAEAAGGCRFGRLRGDDETSGAWGLACAAGAAGADGARFMQECIMQAVATGGVKSARRLRQALTDCCSASASTPLRSATICNAKSSILRLRRRLETGIDCWKTRSASLAEKLSSTMPVSRQSFTKPLQSMSL